LARGRSAPAGSLAARSRASETESTDRRRAHHSCPKAAQTSNCLIRTPFLRHLSRRVVRVEIGQKPGVPMYWTDRGDPPRDNTVNRAPMDPTRGQRKDPEVVFSHLMEGIGLALDLKGGRMFVTDFAGSVYSASLDGSNKKLLLFAEGNLTGIAYAEFP
jgi:hypothetical protein